MPVSIWKQGVACHVKTHRNGREETCYQVDGYVDFDVHIDIYTDAIIQHKAFTRRWLRSKNPMTTMVPPIKTGGPANWKERSDGRNLCLSSSASYKR